MFSFSCPNCSKISVIYLLSLLAHSDFQGGHYSDIEILINYPLHHHILIYNNMAQEHYQRYVALYKYLGNLKCYK